MALKSINYKQHTFDISYDICNPKEHVDLVVLHGWGSNKELMKKSFASTMKGFRHIYVDLPGFGNSTASMVMNTEDVARIVELLLTEIDASKDIIMGHSFGGKVALLLEPQMLVLVASAGIYREKPLSLKAKIVLFKVAKNLGLGFLRRFFVADDAKELNHYMYETFKNVVDEDFSEAFASFSKKALLFWGEADTATPLESAKKMVALLSDATLYTYAGDHYFFMQKSSDIAQKIEENFLKSLEK